MNYEENKIIYDKGGRHCFNLKLDVKWWSNISKNTYTYIIR